MKPSIPKSVNSQAAIAEQICRQFKIRCQQQDIQHWQNLRKIPTEGCTVPFPAPVGRNKYVVEECIAWVEKWIMPHRNGNDAKEKLASMAAKDRLEEQKVEHWIMRNAKDNGRLIDRAKANRTSVSVIKQLLSFYKLTDENLIPQEASAKLESIGVTPEQKKEFLDWLVPRMQSITDQRVARTEKAIEEIGA